LAADLLSHAVEPGHRILRRAADSKAPGEPSRHIRSLGQGSVLSLEAEEVDHERARLRSLAIFFEPMSKRRRGYPSESRVKCGVRVVHGDKELTERLGRNDLCLCGSGKRFKKCCRNSGCF
jgi:uncharacterized protein YchJ